MATEPGESNLVLLPHAWPRPGATLLLENEAGAVWDVQFTQGEYSNFHRHLYHYAGVDLEYAAYEIIRPDGQSETKVSFPGRMWVLPKGLTHMERGISTIGRHIVIIDIKDKRTFQSNGESTLQEILGSENCEVVNQDVFYRQYDIRLSKKTLIEARRLRNDMFFIFIEDAEAEIRGQGQKPGTIKKGDALFVRGGGETIIRPLTGSLRAMTLELPRGE